MRCLKVIAALLMLLALNTAVCFALEEETTDNYSSFYESSGADSLAARNRAARAQPIRIMRWKE